MSDYRFIKTRLSDSAQMLLFADTPPPVSWEAFTEELLLEDCKVSIRRDSKYGGYSYSITGAPDSANSGLIISTFGDTIDSACAKSQQLLTLLPSLHSKWVNIEHQIKDLENQVAQIIRDNLDKLIVNNSHKR